MAKLALPGPSELDARGKEIYADIAASRGGRMLGLFGAMMHRPELAQRVSRLGAHLRFETDLSDAWRELLIVTVASELGCDYEREIHIPLAKKAGVSEVLLSRLQSGEPLPEETAADLSAALRLARELCREGVARQPLGDLREHVDAATAVEVTLLVGYYTMLSQFLRTFEITRADDR